MKDPIIDEEIHVLSSSVDLGDALKEHCRTRIIETGGKYFGKLTRADVHFRHEGQSFACTVKIKSGALDSYASEATDHDAYRAFNQALEKVAKQLRRAKRMIRDEKAHRPEQNNSMLGDELNPQQPVSELLRPVTDDPRTHLPDAEIYERQMQERMRNP